MSELCEGKGSCLCGATRVSVKAMNPKVGACHCEMCTKWTGGPFLGIDCGSDVVFEGTENLSIFSSSEWAERGFCKQCGSHLFYRLKANNQYFILVGVFDDFKDFVFDHQIFIDQKPSFYCFANETQNMTKAEFLAQFASPSA